MTQPGVTDSRTSSRSVADGDPYLSLFRAMHHGVMIMEAVRGPDGRLADLRILDVSGGFGRATGVTPETAVGQLFSRVITPLEEFWLRSFDELEPGEVRRLDGFSGGLGRWFDVTILCLGGDRRAVLYDDITDRKETEDALRESQEQQRILLDLTDRVRWLSDPYEVMKAAAECLARALAISEVSFQLVEGETATTAAEWSDGRVLMPGSPARFRVGGQGPGWLPALLRGENVFTPDAIDDPRGLVADPEHASRSRARFAVPLVEDGELVAFLSGGHPEPRPWTPAEQHLVSEVAVRSWASARRARAETALRASEESARTLFDAMRQAIAVSERIRDVDGRVVDVRLVDFNRAFERETLLSRDDAIGRPVGELPQGIDSWWATSLQSLIEEARSLHVERYHARLQRWFEITAFPFGHDRFATVFHDITERKRAEEVLREAAARQSFLLELTDTLRQLADPRTIQLEACRVLRRRLEAARVVYTASVSEDELEIVACDSLPGTVRLPARLRLVDFRPSHAEAIRNGRVSAVGDCVGERDATKAKQERLRELQIGAAATVPLLKDGALVAMLMVHFPRPHVWQSHELALIQEVAERTWAAAERARAEAAVQAERERREELEHEFVVNAAHELRTPLTAIIAVIESLAAGAIDDAERSVRFFGHLQRETARLARLSESLLLLAQVERNPVIRTEVPVRPLLEEVAAGITLAPGVEVRVIADEALTAETNQGLVERVLWNVAENAAKNTRVGTIELAASVCDGGVVIEVRDTGQGIGPGVEARAFDRFYREGARGADGFGLGLSIARQAADAIGATLELERRDEGGTTARLVLPAAA